MRMYHKKEVPDWCKADTTKLKQTLANIDLKKEMEGNTLKS